MSRRLRVTIVDDSRTQAEIARGLLVLLGVEVGDQPSDADWYAERTAKLRVFPEAEHNMQRSLEDIGGACLVVSQFTLYADTSRGRRPGFTAASPAELAERLYLRFADALRGLGLTVATGRFGAEMEVELVNDGPFTIWLDSADR